MMLLGPGVMAADKPKTRMAMKSSKVLILLNKF
jgi:hypothetical protein